MPGLTTIDDYMGGADNVFFGEIIQGSQFSFVATIVNNLSDKTPQDATNIAVSAKCEFGTATVSGESISNLNIDSGITQRTLTVTKENQNTDPGKFRIQIPSDLYTADIAAAAQVSPVCVIYIKFTDSRVANVTEIEFMRVILAIRHSIS